MEIIKVGIYHDDRVFARALAIGLARESRTIHFVLSLIHISEPTRPY